MPAQERGENALVRGVGGGPAPAAPSVPTRNARNPQSAMTHSLPRLKPDPIPAINPVPEYAADARLARVYEETKQGLGVPWMGVVTMALAQYPTFYAALWSAIAPLAGRQRFAEACTALRAEAEAQADALGPADLTAPLLAMGYAPRELDEIRACIEVFSAGNMPYILIASLARFLLEGNAWDQTGDPGAPQPPAAHPRPPLMEAHHAAPATRALYGDMKARLGLPFVNTDYRALARWPSYFDLAWGDLRGKLDAPRYAAALEATHQRAVALASGLPNVTGLTPGALAEAAARDAPLAEVRDVVRLFQWLLPGLLVNVACLRAQLPQT